MAQARKLLVRALILAVSAGALSAVYQRAAEARDRRRFPAPGRLVPVGGDRRLHLYQAGDGKPAVIIVPALNDSIPEWLHIVREVQQDTTTTRPSGFPGGKVPGRTWSSRCAVGPARRPAPEPARRSGLAAPDRPDRCLIHAGRLAAAPGRARGPVHRQPARLRAARRAQRSSRRTRSSNPGPARDDQAVPVVTSNSGLYCCRVEEDAER